MWTDCTQRMKSIVGPQSRSHAGDPAGRYGGEQEVNTSPIGSDRLTSSSGCKVRRV